MGIVGVLIFLVMIVGQKSNADEILLKDGVVVYGEIIEHVPGKECKIRTPEGRVFSYRTEDIEKVSFMQATKGNAVVLEELRKSPGTAVFLSWLVPSLGHAYSGDWGRGVGFLVSETFLTVLLLKGETSDRFEKVMWRGQLIGLVGIRVWEFFDAYDTAKDYNKSLLGRMSYSVDADHRQALLNIHLRFW